MSLVRRRTHCVCVLVSLSVFCSFAAADIYEWNASAGGDFATESNWTPTGVPGIGDRARFNLDAAGYIVDITGSQYARRVVVLNDTVTFNVTGQLGLDETTYDSYVMIGDNGSHPTINITGGGTFGSANRFDIAYDIDSVATVSILDGTVKSGAELNVGRRGRGTMNIAENGVLNTGKSVIGSYPDAIGRVVMDGGTWNYSSVANPVTGSTNYGNLIIGWDGAGYLTAANGATLTQGDITEVVYIGYKAASNGEVLLEDSGTTWTAGDLVRVGCEGTGVMTLRNGAEMSCKNVYVAAAADSTGSVIVDGGELSLTNQLFVGGNDTSAGGQGMVAIRNGAIVSITNELTLWDNGILHLQDGLLKADKISTAAGGFAWTGGELWVTGVDGLVIGEGGDIQSAFLTFGMTLTVDNVVRVNGLGMLSMRSSGRISCAQLFLDGGTVSSTGAFNVDDVTELRGHGVVNAEISGSSSAMIQADEAMVLGKADSTDGFGFDGTLKVKTYDVTLLDRNRACLGQQTDIGDGGKLTGVNGLRLDAGDTLTAIASCSVHGEFLNDGAVVGPTGAGEFLVFDDDVSGSGSYSGNIEFRQGFAPGNSPGVVSFGEGNASFGADSTLTMEITGLASGEYDRLVDLASLDFNGTLDVVFDYTPAEGDSFNLLDFATFSGSFASVEINGLDPSLTLDLSALATTGIATIRLACPTCPGDLNGDSLVDGRDIQGFVECLLHGTSGSSNCACGASDGTAPPDVDDVEVFVDRLLNRPPPC